MSFIGNLNYYELLEVPKDATKSEIKRAYRKMAEDYHPDKTMHLGKRLRELANLEMTRINKAREVLSDDEKRKRYDEYLQGTRTDDIEDIVLEVDPFEEYEEENWEELRDEILEVDPLEEPVAVEELPEQPDSPELIFETDTNSYSVQTEVPKEVPAEPTAPSKPPFWDRLKSTIKLKETIRKKPRTKDRDSEFLERDWISGLRKIAPTPKSRTGGRPASTDEIVTAEVIKLHPNTPSKSRSYKPDEDDIKVNVLIDLEEKSKTHEDAEIWDEFVDDNSGSGLDDSTLDFEDLEPLEMELVDSGKPEKHQKKRESRLKGLEPKDDFIPKWTGSKKSIGQSKNGDKKELDEELSGEGSSNNVSQKPTLNAEEVPVEMEPIEMELIPTKDDKQKIRKKGSGTVKKRKGSKKKHSM